MERGTLALSRGFQTSPAVTMSEAAKRITLEPLMVQPPAMKRWRLRQLTPADSRGGPTR
jgi:hypothetical protein